MKIKRLLYYLKCHPEKSKSKGFGGVIEPSGNIRFCGTRCHVEVMYRYLYKFYKRLEPLKPPSIDTIKKFENEELNENCLEIEWLCDKYNLIPIWSTGYLAPSRGVNEKQQHVIQLLVDAGIVKLEYVDTTNAFFEKSVYSLFKNPYKYTDRFNTYGGNCNVDVR